MLKYAGGGFILGVPARDLSADEARLYGEEKLVASGLYKRERVRAEDKMERKRSYNKEIKDGEEI